MPRARAAWAMFPCAPSMAATMAARALGINRSTLYYRMRKHGLEHLLPMKETTGTVTTPGPSSTSSDPAGAPRPPQSE